MPIASTATVAEALPGGQPTASPASEARASGHTPAKFPHRRVFVEATWRAALDHAKGAAHV